MREYKCICCGTPIETNWPHQQRKYCSECKRKVAAIKSNLSHIKVAQKLDKRCIDCGKQFNYASIRIGSIRCRPCNFKHMKRENAPSWKGGIAHREGYIWLYFPQDHPHKTGNYIAQHVLNWEEYNHKPLPMGFTVHHLNGVKDDNRGKNLVALPHKQHSSGLLNKALRQRILDLENQLSQTKLL